LVSVVGGSTLFDAAFHATRWSKVAMVFKVKVMEDRLNNTLDTRPCESNRSHPPSDYNAKNWKQCDAQKMHCTTTPAKKKHKNSRMLQSGGAVAEGGGRAGDFGIWYKLLGYICISFWGPREKREPPGGLPRSTRSLFFELPFSIFRISIRRIHIITTSRSV